MPVHKPVFDPPFNVVRSSHVELGVRDLARSRAFYVDCLGLLVSDETDGALYLRGVEERDHHSIVLRRGRDADVRALGFKLASEDDVDRAAAWFARRNLPTAFPDVPHQGRTLRTADIFGTPLDLYAQMDQRPSMLQKYATYQGARIQRIDHLNCFTPDVQASYEFYAALGFRLTEYSETDGADPKLWAVWLQRKGNVHDLAFTNGVGPRLHHVEVWTASVLDIIHICDVMATSGYLANMERAAPAPTAYPTRSFSISATPTATGSSCSPRTISPSIPTTCRSAGRRPTRSGRPCGATRRRPPGSSKARCSPASRRASPRSPRNRS